MRAYVYMYIYVCVCLSVFGRKRVHTNLGPLRGADDGDAPGGDLPRPAGADGQGKLLHEPPRRLLDGAVDGLVDGEGGTGDREVGRDRRRHGPPRGETLGVGLGFGHCYITKGTGDQKRGGEKKMRGC